MENQKKPIRAVIITAEAFEDEEVIYPLIRMKEENFNVKLATKDKKLVIGREGYPLELLVRYYAEHVDTKDLRPEDFDLVLIPGGFEAPDRVRQNKDVLQFVKAMHEQGKIVSAFCHGPWVLISAGIVKGKRIAAYPGIKDDVNNAGATYVDEPAVIDGNIVTARHPRDVTHLMRVLLQVVKS